MEYSTYDYDKRGIDDPGLNQDISFTKKDDEDFDDTDDFHKFDDTDQEEKLINPPLRNEGNPLNKRPDDKDIDSTNGAGKNDGNIYI